MRSSPSQRRPFGSNGRAREPSSLTDEVAARLDVLHGAPDHDGEAEPRPVESRERAVSPRTPTIGPDIHSRSKPTNGLNQTTGPLAYGVGAAP